MSTKIEKQNTLVTIQMNTEDKQALQKLADAKRMPLATFCRMILLDLLKEVK